MKIATKFAMGEKAWKTQRRTKLVPIKCKTCNSTGKVKIVDWPKKRAACPDCNEHGRKRLVFGEYFVKRTGKITGIDICRRSRSTTVEYWIYDDWFAERNLFKTKTEAQKVADKLTKKEKRRV